MNGLVLDVLVGLVRCVIAVGVFAGDYWAFRTIHANPAWAAGLAAALAVITVLGPSRGVTT